MPVYQFAFIAKSFVNVYSVCDFGAMLTVFFIVWLCENGVVFSFAETVCQDKLNTLIGRAVQLYYYL